MKNDYLHKRRCGFVGSFFLLLSTIMIVDLLPSSAYAQVKKPSLMILPSDNWCEQRYYMVRVEDNGIKKKVPNYKQAFQEDPELNLVIAKIGGLLLKKGIILKDAEQELKAIEARSADERMLSSNKSQADVLETPLDVLKNKARSDVIIQVWWNAARSTNGIEVAYSLDAFDAYTSERIATISGSSVILP